MTLPLLFALSSLAAFRLWRLLAVDRLPPLMWPRDRLEAFVDRRFGTVWADGITCPHCSGSWVAFAVVAAVWACHPLPLPALWFGAVAASVGFLAQWDQP